MLWLRAIRCYQWVKNVLVFLPAAFAHRLAEPAVARQSFMAALSFSLMASAIYLFNDWRDREHDALHPVKRLRPLASGAVNASAALALAGGLGLISMLIALRLPPGYLFIDAGYALAAIAYSCWLKRLVLVDMFVLAGFYTARIYAGSLATGIQISQWLLLFSMFIFLALGFQKRLAELSSILSDEKSLSGRGYLRTDIEQLRPMGHAAGFVAVLVFALYIQSPDVSSHYANPAALWWICPLMLFWLCRLWLLTGRGLLREDAIIFALGDKVSLCLGVLVMLAILLAQPVHPAL